MNYFVIAIFIILILIFWFLYIIRRKRAIKKVLCNTDEEKLTYINAALSPFGFSFDVDQDIVISNNDAWQRDLGYTDFYDLKAPFFNIVMDSMPIYFEYNNKKYRLEFWKGQYGITTGAEVGLYIQDNNSKIKDFYRSAYDSECLDMNFVLYKKCRLFSRSEYSWWITGFDVGNFSKPSDLKMKICIQFSDVEMLASFIKGLIEAGYSRNNIAVCNLCVCIEFCCSSNYKLNNSCKLLKFFVQIINYINCKIFMYYTRHFNRIIDKLTYLKYMMPCIYRLIIRISIPRKRYKKFCSKR